MERRLEETVDEAGQRQSGLAERPLRRRQALRGAGEARLFLLVGAGQRPHDGGLAVRPELQGGVVAPTVEQHDVLRRRDGGIRSSAAIAWRTVQQVSRT